MEIPHKTNAAIRYAIDYKYQHNDLSFMQKTRMNQINLCCFVYRIIFKTIELALFCLLIICVFFYLLSSLRLNMIVDSALKQHLAENGKSRKLFKVSLFHVLRAYASWWYTAAEFKLLNLKWRSHFVKIQTSWAHLCISDCVVWNVWLLRLMYDALA